MITTTVYGGDTEMRIRQEIMLGIGGMRALLAMGIKPTICHLNEGHTAFSALERIRHMMNESKMIFRRGVRGRKGRHRFYGAYAGPGGRRRIQHGAYGQILRQLRADPRE